MSNKERVAKLVTELNGLDVIMGRGKGANNRPGNKNFRGLASERVRDYEVSGTGGRKTEIARQLIKQLEAKGARFLRPVTALNAKGEVIPAWEIVGAEAKLTKVKQAIRDAASAQTKKRGGKSCETKEHQQWPRPIEDQAREREGGQESTQSQPQQHPPISAQHIQQEGLFAPSSSRYNLYPPPPLSMPPGLTIEALLVRQQAREERERLLLQHEIALYRQEVQELAQYRYQLRNLQTANSLAQYPQQTALSVATLKAARLNVNLLRASSRCGNTRSAFAPQNADRSSAVGQQQARVRETPSYAAAASRKRTLKQTGVYPEESEEEGHRKKSLISSRIQPPPHADRSAFQTMKSCVAVHPLGSAQTPSPRVTGQNYELLSHRRQRCDRVDIASIAEEDENNTSSDESKTTSCSLGIPNTNHQKLPKQER